MRAAVLYGKEEVRVEEVPESPLEAGEVRVAIEAALTCGTDLKVYKRGYHARMIVPPAVFGHELAGTIAEVTPEAKRAGWQAGERVVVANSAPCGDCFYCRNRQENLCDDLLFLNGAYAESIVVPRRLAEKNMHRVTERTPARHAALVEPLACVVQGREDCAWRAGDKVLIIGSGPIGLLFAALAIHDECLVTVAGKGAERLKRAEELGARPVDVTGADEFTAAVDSAGGKDFDLVIEAVGKPETWSGALKLVRKGGKINFFGGCPSGTTIPLDTGLVHYSNLTLLASFHHTPRAIREALRLIERGEIGAESFIDGEWPLSRLPELFARMAGGNKNIKTHVRVRE